MAEPDRRCETKIDFNETYTNESKLEQENHEVLREGQRFIHKLGLPIMNRCLPIMNRCGTIAITALIIVLSISAISSQISQERVLNNRRYEKILESIQELQGRLNATQPISSTQVCSIAFPGNTTIMRNDTDYPSWPNKTYSLQINQVFHLLQDLVQQVELINNTSFHHFSDLKEVIFNFKEEAFAGISKLGIVVAENTDHVKNMSKHVNHLSQSRDEHTNILNLVAANLSSISSHLVQLSSKLALLKSSQLLHTQKIGSLQSTISGLQSQLTSLNELLASHGENIQDKLTDLNEDLEKLQKDSSAASTDREDIKNSINDLKELHSSSVQLYPSVIIIISIVIAKTQFYFC